LLSRNIIFVDSTPSTNTEAWRIISKGASSGIVITDQQLNGKGQRGRKWVFQGGRSVAFSFFSNHVIDSNKIGYLPILSGLAVNNALTKLDISSQLKWPNDIIVNGKKIGGILCESTIRKKSSRSIVIGIGMNINQEENDVQNLNIPNAGSLKTEYNRVFVREEIISSVINNLEILIQSFPKNINQINRNWMKACAHLNQDVELSYNSKKIKGIFKGLGDNGVGIVEKNGKRIDIASGSIF
tara:strand:- start:3621 stop:4343 length:723 start_codon:yes stop_codon:yes gene_type:complete